MAFAFAINSRLTVLACPGSGFCACVGNHDMDTVAKNIGWRNIFLIVLPSRK
jgi:hypothetical protein